jgi:hypothetical protein
MLQKMVGDGAALIAGRSGHENFGFHAFFSF